MKNGPIDIMVKDFPYLQAIHVNISEKGNGFLMFICGFTVAVILYNDSYDFFNSHSRNQPGKMVVNGQTVLLKFFTAKQFGKVYLNNISSTEK